MKSDLENSVSIVTGAASGIGQAVALNLAQQGCKLVLVDLNQDGLQQTAETIAASGAEVVALQLDICQQAQMQQMAQTALDRFGQIDHLVAAAGILRPSPELKQVTDTSLDEWRRVIDINLTGTFLSNQAVLPAMLARKKGDIVNVSSVSGRQGKAFDAAYSASKAGIIGLSESLAEEVGASGIRVQTLLPDAVDTPIWNQNGSAAFAKPPQAMPPAHVAEFIVWMLAMPRDCQLLNPVIAPTRQRRGGKKRT